MVRPLAVFLKAGGCCRRTDGRRDGRTSRRDAPPPPRPAAPQAEGGWGRGGCGGGIVAAGCHGDAGPRVDTGRRSGGSAERHPTGKNTGAGRERAAGQHHRSQGGSRPRPAAWMDGPAAGPPPCAAPARPTQNPIPGVVDPATPRHAPKSERTPGERESNCWTARPGVVAVLPRRRRAGPANAFTNTHTHVAPP